MASGRSYLDPSVRLLPEPKGVFQDPAFPRLPGEDGQAYIERYARHLGGTVVKSMPVARMPYKDAEEVDRGNDPDAY